MSKKHIYSEFGYMRAADGRAWRSLSDGPFATREVSGREPVAVGVKPECEGCKIASHGFMCHFADGSCLKSIYERRTHNAVGDVGAGPNRQVG